MHNKLRGTRAYLCGAMDRAADGGVGWRRMIRARCQDYGIRWLDPTRKPIDIGEESDENRQLRNEAKARGDYQMVVDAMHSIRCVDLRMVDISDWLVVNLDMDIHACGTYEEIFLANRQKKPILVHVEQGKPNAPDWLFGTIPHEHIFSTWQDMFAYLYEVAYSEVETFGRWYFFDWTGDR